MAADSDRALEVAPDDIDHYRNLVKETGALFGARHYRNYHFLYTLSDHVAHFGLEHHESSDDRTGERTLIEPDRFKRQRLPAAARVRALLERQVPPPRRPALRSGRDGGYDTAHEGRPAVGVRRAHQLPGRSTGAPQRPLEP